MICKTQKVRVDKEVKDNSDFYRSVKEKKQKLPIKLTKP